jgi:hypothetical protein
MNVYEKLINVQSELRAPKGQYNSFGKYNYRSCEDILEALKPVLQKNKATVTVSDKIFSVNESDTAVRIYVEATASFIDTESMEKVEVTAYAHEGVGKNGMDASQVTGATSSYARKYALNGLFLIDDNKDADTDEFAQQNKDEGKTTKPTGKNGAKTSDDKKNQKMIESVDKVLLPTADGKVTGEQIDRLKAEIKRVGTTEKDFCTLFKVANIFELTQAQIIAAIGALTQKKDGEGLKKK